MTLVRRLSEFLISLIFCFFCIPDVYANLRFAYKIEDPRTTFKIDDFVWLRDKTKESQCIVETSRYSYIRET
jgi:hypothetical protein